MTNVFLFTLDAFRADVIGPERTPFLSRITDEGIAFTDAVATGPGTSSAFPGILAGVLPLEYGYAEFREEHTTVAEQVNSTAHTIGISSSAPTSRIYGFNRGFDKFVDGQRNELLSTLKKRLRQNDFIYETAKRVASLGRTLFDENGAGGLPYTPADEVTDTVLTEIGEPVENDLFLWAHYMDAHTPYFPPERYFPDAERPAFSRSEVNSLLKEYHNEGPSGEGRELTGEEMEALRYYYRAETGFVDAQIERAFDAIERSFDDFVVIVCADHGEEFGEHGDHGHLPKLYQELIHVPLIIYESDGGSDTVQHPVSTARVPATIADALGSEPSTDWCSPSLLAEPGPVDGDQPVISEVSHTADEGLGGTVQPEKAHISVRSGEWKYIHDSRLSSEELYDLESDPSESRNLIDESPGCLDELRTARRSRLAQLSRSARVDVPEDVADQLEELGYL